MYYIHVIIISLIIIISLYFSSSVKNIEYNNRNTSDTIIINETYDDYLDKRKNIQKTNNNNNDEWIYNMLNGEYNSEILLFSNDKFIIIKPKEWNNDNIDDFHVVSFVKNTNIKSIRDLTSNDIPLLEHIKNITLRFIQIKYGIKSDKLRMYFHYHPSTWVLHIHFNLIKNFNTHSSIEYSYSLNDVIHNLELDTNYYKNIMYVTNYYK